MGAFRRGQCSTLHYNSKRKHAAESRIAAVRGRHSSGGSSSSQTYREGLRVWGLGFSKSPPPQPHPPTAIPSKPRRAIRVQREAHATSQQRFQRLPVLYFSRTPNPAHSLKPRRQHNERRPGCLTTCCSSSWQASESFSCTRSSRPPPCHALLQHCKSCSKALVGLSPL